MATASTVKSNGNVPLPHADTIQAKFDLGIAVSLFDWPVLSLAVQSHWGGGDSEAKREWFAGAVSDLFTSRPETDLEDVETVLLQVMLDEFDVNVDDESAYDVAELIMLLRAETLKGNFQRVDSLHADWVKRKGKSAVKLQLVEGENDDAADASDSVDDETGSSEDSDDDDDVEMGDAAAPAPVKEKDRKPEIDDEGFTKVTGRQKPR
ncbi:MAG: hypothetical protein M1825_005521 [Sarcosagium campestre]|nr:MAG: hypothetical protein M1825_005521 [Sarcosagium campestre]